MKTKSNHVVEYIILGVLGCLVVFTLVAPQLLRDRRPPQLLSLSVLLRDTDSSNWTVARQGMEQAADELGAELRFLTLTAQGGSEEQEELINREIEGGADALVAAPFDPDALALLQRQTACPVVTLEFPVEGGAGTVSPDNEAVGRSLAQALLEDWDNGAVVLLDNSESCPEVRIRLEAALEVLTQAGVPALRLTALPERWGEERWAIAFESGATRQAAEYKEAEERSFALYGVGSSTAITTHLERGTIAAAAAWSDYAAGYLAVRQAVEAAQGEGGVLSPLSFSVVRGEDIYAPDNQKLLFPIMSSSGR